MTILIDMDDTMEQLARGWIRYLNQRYGTDTRPEDAVAWDMSRAFPSLTKEQVYAALDEDELWDEVLPMPGAAETIQRLMEEGHQIYVVTATGYRTLKAKMEKVLFKYFPFITWDQVIITRDKHMVQGDVLIDDGPHNLERGTYRKILFDAVHNRSFDESTVGAVRASTWEEVYDLL